MFALFQFLVVMVMAIFMVMIAAVAGQDESGDPGPIFWLFLVLFLLVYLGLFFIPGIAVTVRRLHDQGQSGWMYLLSLIPYVGGLVIFVFMCLPGTRGPNQYGDDPLGTEYLSDVFR